VPVVVGTAAAHSGGGVIWWRAVAALVVSVALQIGTNYANDYSDGVRGTDEARVGPARLVASGLKRPAAVKRAALAAFGLAAAAGLALAAAAGWWLLAVGAACIAAGWFYTGGPRPYGYAGFGEVFVFVFFGLVATVGTAYVQTGRVTALSTLVAVPVGLLAVALLVVNNLRDIPGDTLAGKRTLAVVMGPSRTRVAFQACIVGAFVLVFAIAALRAGGLLALAAAPIALFPVQAVRRGATAQQLIPVLGATGRTQLAFGCLLAVGVWI